jgi:hypothetical protein
MKELPEKAQLRRMAQCSSGCRVCYSNRKMIFFKEKSGVSASQTACSKTTGRETSPLRGCNGEMTLRNIRRQEAP